MNLCKKGDIFMEWKKAKTILIWLFILVDIYLLFVNIYNNYGNNKIEYDKLKDVLLQNNIYLPKDVVTKNKKTFFVNEYKKIDITNEIKDTLLGDCEETSKGRFISKNKNKILKINDDEIYYENKSPNFEGFEKINEKNAKNILKKYLKLLNIYDYVVLENVEKENDKLNIRYKFVIDNSEMFSSFLNFVVSNKGIHKIYGTVSVPNGKKGYDFELSNIETILLNFSRNNQFNKEVKIKEIKSGCYLADYKNAVTAQALPAYMIKTENKSYIYDARSGVDSSLRELSIR